MLQDPARVQKSGNEVWQLVSLSWTAVQADKCWLQQVPLEVQERGVCCLQMQGHLSSILLSWPHDCKRPCRAYYVT